MPDADDGREFGPHALETGSCDLSLPAVEGRVPLPPEDGRWLGEPALPSVLGEEILALPHAFVVAKDDRLPQVSVPLKQVANIVSCNDRNPFKDISN